jgi:RecA/RadA recombinase
MDRADFFKRQVTAHKARFGADKSVDLEEFAGTHVGLPIPHPALQYLLTSEVLLLSRIMAISGAPGSNKSALGYEMARIFIDGGGVASLIETENKASGSLMRSILAPSESYQPFYDVKKADSIELAQDYVTSIVEDREKQMAAAQKGRTKKAAEHTFDDELAQLVMVDSIVGTPSDETSEKIMADGHADRAHPKEALVLARFFPTLSSKLEGLPLLFLFTNHEKLDLKSMVGGVRNPGGDALHFYSTYHIRVQKIGHIPSKVAQGNKLKLSTKKNSMGPDRRSIEMSFSWWSEPAPELPEKVRQVSTFDWDGAWLDLLAGSDIPRSKLSEVLTVVKHSADSYSCTALGMKDAPPKEMMKAFAEHPAEYELTKRILGICAWRTHGAGQKA